MIVYIYPVIQYGTFFAFLILGINQLIKGIYSTDERTYMKRKFVNSLKSQQKKILKTNVDSEINYKFRQAGYPKMNDTKWMMIRMVIIIVPVIYLFAKGSFLNGLLILAALYFATDMKFKFSVLLWHLNARKKSIQQRKEIELFTLFALLKTDLMAATSSQVNVYHLVSETLPYFQDIKYVLVKFLSLWKESPKEAGSVFQNELDGETANFIGDVLSRMNDMNRQDALNLLSEQGVVFTYKRAELALQREEKKRLTYFTLFFVSSFVGMIWFLYFIYSAIKLDMVL